MLTTTLPNRLSTRHAKVNNGTVSTNPTFFNAGIEFIRLDSIAATANATIMPTTMSDASLPEWLSCDDCVISIYMSQTLPIIIMSNWMPAEWNDAKSKSIATKF